MPCVSRRRPEDRIREYAASAGVPCYGITLGDHVNNKWTLFTNMVVALQPEQTGVPVFATIGNHDHEFPTADEKAARAKYESYFGPVDYSFNRGDVHVVSMDNVIHSCKASADYEGGFTAAQYAWLKQDLSFVPKDKMVILCVHIPFRGGWGTNSAHADADKYYDEVLDLLSQYEYAAIMSAHTHSNINYIHRKNGQGDIRACHGHHVRRMVAFDRLHRGYAHRIRPLPDRRQPHGGVGLPFGSSRRTVPDPPLPRLRHLCRRCQIPFQTDGRRPDRSQHLELGSFVDGQRLRKRRTERPDDTQLRHRRMDRSLPYRVAEQHGQLPQVVRPHVPLHAQKPRCVPRASRRSTASATSTNRRSSPIRRSTPAISMPISNIQTDETYTPMKKYLFLTLLAAAFLAGGGCSSSDDDGWGVIELASPKLKVTTELATATVTWDAVAKTAGYAYALDGAADYTSVDAATTTVTLTALAEGGHTFRLKAVGDLDHTTDSAERTIDFEIDPTLPQPAPTYVKGDETGSVVVSWPAVKGAAGYAYKFGEAASFTEVGADVLSVTQKGLSAEEPIRFTMYAVGQLPDSKDSEPVSLTFQLVDTSEGVWVRKSNGELFELTESEAKIYTGTVSVSAADSFEILVENVPHGFLSYSGNGGVGTVNNDRACVPFYTYPAAEYYVRRSLGRMASDPLNKFWINLTADARIDLRIDVLRRIRSATTCNSSKPMIPR